MLVETARTFDKFQKLIKETELQIMKIAPVSHNSLHPCRLGLLLTQAIVASIHGDLYGTL